MFRFGIRTLSRGSFLPGHSVYLTSRRAGLSAPAELLVNVSSYTQKKTAFCAVHFNNKTVNKQEQHVNEVQTCINSSLNDLSQLANNSMKG